MLRINFVVDFELYDFRIEVEGYYYMKGLCTLRVMLFDKISVEYSYQNVSRYTVTKPNKFYQRRHPQNEIICFNDIGTSKVNLSICTF